MGIEFKKPLIIGDIDASVKSDISQIKQDIGDLSQLDTADKSSLVNALNEAMDSTLNAASRDLDNLSDEGNEKLRSLNAYANEGELLTDPDGLAFVKRYSHSTFDLSKFTIVGSPNITDDGVVTTNYASYPSETEFASLNNLKCNFDVTTLRGKSWTISIPFKISANTTKLLCIAKDNTTINYNNTYCQIRFSSSLYLSVPTGVGDDTSNNYDVVYIGQGEISPYYNQDLMISLSFNISTGTYTMKLTDANGGSLGSDSKYVKTFTPTTANKELQSINGAVSDAYLRFIPLNNCTEDLKGLKIVADGVPVFSGNKTGIDTIKPDDYTVVGSPTISADGVASGFSSSGNYLRQALSITPKKEVLIKGKFTYTHDTHVQIIFNCGLTRIGIASTYITVNYYNNTHTTYNYTCSEGDIIEFEMLVQANKQTLRCKINGISGTPVKTSHELTLSEITYCLFGQYSTAGYGNSFTGTIDLPAFKIYVDGNLVYQPCLKIPYTESKTGSKVVNAIYRSRVNDMAEQFGYANYYTLDEDSGNFTLPQVELYGLIGQRTLRDSYRNGINYWELYSNRDLEQGGSCTSGVEVTFARPFADTNYVLSVPYSAKSTTAFTPTQTGDWIAKGKGVL